MEELIIITNDLGNLIHNSLLTSDQRIKYLDGLRKLYEAALNKDKNINNSNEVKD